MRYRYRWYRYCGMIGIVKCGKDICIGSEMTVTTHDNARLRDIANRNMMSIGIMSKNTQRPRITSTMLRLKNQR